MDSLTIDLFAPGMGPLHRAGLGGLACSLDRLDWPRGEWEMDEQSRRLTLRWPDGESGARAFFERLYSQAFNLDDAGMIHLPGAYGGELVRPWIKAELQRGMSLTILQFGPNRKAKSKQLKVVSYEIDKQVVVEHQELVGYTHRAAWEDLVTPAGSLRERVQIQGTIAPGFVQRHVAHKVTTIEESPSHAVALHFALVGTLSLPIGRSGKGVLIVPDVVDLKEFIRRRPRLNPTEAHDCQIVSPADAALQAQVRLRAAEAGATARVNRCLAVLFSSTMWNPNQKARAAVLYVEPTETELDLFDETLAIPSLNARLVETRPEKKGAQPRKFWAGGIVRALIAENLAHHRPWFVNFRGLIVGADGKTDEQRVKLLSFEKEGLRAMIERPWKDRGEETFVRTIHQAMAQCFGRIWDESNEDTTTFNNRYDRQMERWRLAFAHAKTADDVRHGLSEIWGKAGQVPLLMESWQLLLPVLCDDARWQVNRDLALLALSSYKSKRKRGKELGPPEAEA